MDFQFSPTPKRGVRWKTVAIALLGAGACAGFGGCAPAHPSNEAVSLGTPQQQQDEEDRSKVQIDAETAAAQSAAEKSRAAVTTAPATAPTASAAQAADANPSADKSDDDDDLTALQTATLQFPAKIRLGVVHWSAAGAAATAGDLVFTDPDMQKQLTTHLEAGGRVSDVVFIPAWMTAGLKVGKLRAIAARCKVDALLVYDDTCTVSSLGTGEPIVGACTGEAILLDGKTGLIPATFSAAGDHSAAAPPRDVDPGPERDGVAQRASLEAALKIADAAAKQLNAMP